VNTQTEVVKSILNYISGSSSIYIAAGKHLPHVYSFGFFSFLVYRIREAGDCRLGLVSIIIVLSAAKESDIAVDLIA